MPAFDEFTVILKIKFDKPVPDYDLGDGKAPESFARGLKDELLSSSSSDEPWGWGELAGDLAQVVDVQTAVTVPVD